MTYEKWAIMVISRRSGDTVYLGGKFKTREEANEFARKEICLRCNRIELQKIDANSQWQNSREGFRCSA